MDSHWPVSRLNHRLIASGSIGTVSITNKMYRELLEQLEGYGASVDEGVRGGS
jgi:hypothetical protein